MLAERISSTMGIRGLAAQQFGNLRRVEVVRRDAQAKLSGVNFSAAQVHELVVGIRHGGR
jgi:hypothetical protein